MNWSIKDFIEEIARPHPRGHDESYCNWLAHQLYVKVISQENDRVVTRINRFGDRMVMRVITPANIVITNRSY